MKMLRIKLIFYCLFFSTTGFCQNLVDNWSFEDTIPCIANPFIGIPETAPPWKSYMQSPDFWSLTYCGGGMPFGFQIPKSGSSLVGIGVYDSLNSFLNEVFGQELGDSLISGHTYCVSFYVSLAEISQYGIDKLGALFTSFEPDPAFLSTFTAIPQVENPSGQIITDTLNWIQISGSFIAQGGEKYISLGNFNALGNFQFAAVPYSTPTSASYYYFDNISVIDCTVGLDENSEMAFNIFPNPIETGEYLEIQFKNLTIETYNVSIYSLDGKLLLLKSSQDVFNNELIIPINLEPGFYAVTISGQKGISNSKIVVLD